MFIAYTLATAASLALLAATAIALAQVGARSRGTEPLSDGVVALVALAPALFGLLFARLLREAPGPTSAISYYAYLDVAREAAVRAVPGVVGRALTALVATTVVGAALIASVRRTTPLRSGLALLVGAAIGVVPTTLTMGDRAASHLALLSLLVASSLIASPLLTLATDLPHARLVVQSSAIALVSGTGAEFALPWLSRAFYRTDTLLPLAHGLYTLRAAALLLVVVELLYACLRRGAERPGYGDIGVVAMLAWLVYMLRPFAPFTFYAPP